MYLEDRMTKFVRSAAVSLLFLLIIAVNIGVFVGCIWLAVIVLRALGVLPPAP